MVGLALVQVSHLCVWLPLLGGMQAKPLAHRLSLLTGTILRLPHRLRALCTWLTVRAPLWPNPGGLARMTHGKYANEMKF